MTFTSRIDDNPLTELFSLGELCVSNFIPKYDNTVYPKKELKVCIDETTGLVQLEQSVDLDTMYKQYWYKSGTNESMRNHLKEIVDSIEKRIGVSTSDIWLDIAANDMTLLSNVKKALRVACDPSDVSRQAYHNNSLKDNAHTLINDYFSKDVVKEFGKFKVITAIAMFYDLNDPLKFLEDIYDSLEDNGLFVIELSYLPLMIKQLAFDTICHEHCCFYTLGVIKELYLRAGLSIVDVKLNECNGGSFRVYAQKMVAKEESFGTAPYRDIANYRINSILEYEDLLDFRNIDIYHEFFENIQILKKQTSDFIKQEREAGKVIMGYGGSTKGNTLLQYFGLDNTLIDAIAERQPMKWGLKTIGTNIPIISEEEMRCQQPDYLLVLPWHFISEFKQREARYLRNGGKFIVPCPKFEIL